MWGTPCFFSWVLGFSRKNPKKGWVDDIYTFLKKSLGLIYLSLYPYKISFHPWKFHKFVLHPLEIPGPKENPHDFFLITPRKSTSFLTDSGISAGFFQYLLKLHVLNSPYLAFFWNWVVIKMRLVSIILKEIKSKWIRKYQFLLFFMLRQLKTTDSLTNSDEVAWNLAISEANLSRGSQNSFDKLFLKNFMKFTEKDLFHSLFFKTFCNFKRRLWHKRFLLKSEFF